MYFLPLAHSSTQVVGVLAAEAPVDGGTVSGILIKRGFKYHLMAPSDLPSQLLACVLLHRTCTCM